MRLDLSLSIEIRPLRDGDLDRLEWDSEQAIQAEYVRKTAAERGDDVVFLLALANEQPIGRLGLEAARLYRRLGYRDDGVERSGNGEVILLLRRSIAEIQASA